MVSQQNDELVRVYRGISEECVAAVEAGDWPRSSYLLSHCVPAPTVASEGASLEGTAGSLVPRRFEEDPVVGLNALLGTDPRHVRMLTEARRLFGAFVDELGGHVAEAERRRELAVHWCAPSSWHTVVAIFQENPALLPEAEREQWRPVAREAVDELGAELAASFAADPARELAIRLHGYRLTADGAMIAVFLDDEASGGVGGDDGGGGFTALRARAKEVGTATLGALTSRPKKLIHVTIGRVLKLPDGISAEVRRMVNWTVRRWVEGLQAGAVPSPRRPPPVYADRGNDERASSSPPRRTSEERLETETVPLPGVGQVLVISEVVVSTEQQWWMADYTIVVRLPLAGT